MFYLQASSLAVFCSYFLVFLTFGSSHRAAARSLFKRDTPLATVNIPLTVNSDRRYIVGVNMSSSPVQQSFRFALSSNTGYSAVAGVACNGCDGVPTYNASASDTERPYPGSANITVGSASISGPFIKENCSLHEANGTAWQYPNQTIIVTNTSSSLFSNVTSGLIGLGTNANGLSGDFYDTIFGGWLTRNPSRDNFTFGMDLKPPVFTSDDDQGNGGVLHWVVPDSSAYQGNITWVSASVSSSPANTSTGSGNVSGVSANTVSGLEMPETDWSIELDGWTASISGTAVANTSTAQALIEPFFPDIVFPASQANLFYAAVPSAVKMNALVDGAQAWTIPCDTTLSVAFTFGGQAFPLDQSQLVEKQADGSCIGTIKAWPDDSTNTFMLGSNFISALYLIFVVGRPGSGVPNAVGIVPRAVDNGSGTPVGAIVGGTVGGVAGLAVLFVAGYWLGRRRRLRSSHESTLPKVNEKEKFISSRNEEGSDEGGAQYAVNRLHNYGPHKQSPTTPLTGNSTQPLLPEAHDPQTPAFNVPNTPNTPSDFLAISSGASSHRTSHIGEPSVASHISYNTQALGANVSASRVAPSYPSSARTMTVEPFVPPAASETAITRASKVIPGPSAPVDPPGVYNSSSPQDIDPLSSSTVTVTGSSARDTAQPFILAPVPESAILRANVPIGSRPPASPPREGTESPAPPYTAQATYTVSPTLVESSQNSAADAPSSQQRREKA